MGASGAAGGGAATVSMGGDKNSALGRSTIVGLSSTGEAGASKRGGS